MKRSHHPASPDAFPFCRARPILKEALSDRAAQGREFCRRPARGLRAGAGERPSSADRARRATRLRFCIIAPRMKVSVPKETRPGERRVALAPDTVKKLVASGLSVDVQTGAGLEAGFSDADFTAAGASLQADREALLAAPTSSPA
jgi:hypothetical protein